MRRSELFFVCACILAAGDVHWGFAFAVLAMALIALTAE